MNLSKNSLLIFFFKKSNYDNNKLKKGFDFLGSFFKLSKPLGIEKLQNGITFQD